MAKASQQAKQSAQGDDLVAEDDGSVYSAVEAPTTISNEPSSPFELGSTPLSQEPTKFSAATPLVKEAQTIGSSPTREYSASVLSQDHIYSNTCATKSEVNEASLDQKADTVSVISVIRYDVNEDDEADVEEIPRPQTPSSPASNIPASKDSSKTSSSDLILRLPRRSATSGSLTLADSSPRSPFRCQRKLWREAKTSPLLRTEWTEVRVESLESDNDADEDGLACQMAVTWREKLLHQCNKDLASDAYAAEAAASMRAIEIADMEDDHAAEVADLKEEIETLKASLKAQGEELTKANKKRNQQRTSWTKTNREKLQYKKELEAERANVNPLKKQVEDTATEIANLQQALEAERARSARLEKDVKHAAQEVGFLHNQGWNYRCAMEDEDPARTALFDGHIQAQKAEICRLEDSLRICNKEIPRLKKLRDAERLMSEGEIKGLWEELRDRKRTLDAVTQSRGQWQAEFEKIIELFKQKICFDDMVKVICDDRDALKADNQILAEALQQRETMVAEVWEEIGSRDADIVGLRYVLRAEKTKADVLVGEKAQLIQSVDEGRWIREAQEGSFQEKLTAARNLNGQLQTQVDNLQSHLRSDLQDSVPDMVQRSMLGKDQEIQRLSNLLQDHEQKLKQANDELLLLGKLRKDSKGLPVKSTFFGVGGLQDWNCAAVRQRLNFAEAQLVPGQAEVLKEIGEKGPLRMWFEMYGERYGKAVIGSTKLE